MSIVLVVILMMLLRLCWPGESVDDVFLRHERVPAPLEVGRSHRVGEEKPGELAGHQETSHSFEHLQAVGRGVLQGGSLLFNIDKVGL